MGLFDSWADILSAATPWSEAEAEAPTRGGVGTSATPAQGKVGDELEGASAGHKSEGQDTSAPKEVGKEDAAAAGEQKDDSEDEPEEEEEEEEDEDEMVDPKEKFEAECKESKQCAPAKHHFDHCVERVNNADKSAPHEDCVEEFFHLAHCANDCAAPKVWAALK